LLLHRPVAGKAGAWRVGAANRDAQPFTQLDPAAFGHTDPHLDQAVDLLAHPGYAQPDALQYRHAVQHLDAAAYPDPHRDLHTFAGAFQYPDANAFCDGNQYPAASADLYRYSHQYTQPNPQRDRYARPVAHSNPGQLAGTMIGRP
jgi:hypothetical protein